MTARIRRRRRKSRLFVLTAFISKLLSVCVSILFAFVAKCQCCKFDGFLFENKLESESTPVRSLLSGNYPHCRHTFVQLRSAAAGRFYMNVPAGDDRPVIPFTNVFYIHLWCLIHPRRGLQD